MSRGPVVVSYGGTPIAFHPLKYWPRYLVATNATLRKWLRLGVLRSYVMYDMHVMSLAELKLIGSAVRQWYAVHSMNADLTDEFIAELQTAQHDSREALDCLKRGLSLTDRQKIILSPSLKEHEDAASPAAQAVAAARESNRSTLSRG